MSKTIDIKGSRFFKQAELMLRAMSQVAKEKSFAVKGGTAINLFVRDMPRLSVDIDLAYLPIENRNVSLKKTPPGNRGDPIISSLDSRSQKVSTGIAVTVFWSATK